MTLFELFEAFDRENEENEESGQNNSTYGEIIARLKDSGAFISNKMMCNLLSKKTGANWTYEVVENGALRADLHFRNDMGEDFLPQTGMLDRGGNLGYDLDYVIKRLENINWFQEYLSASKNPNSYFLEMDLVTGQKGYLFPPYIQLTLEDFFKHVEIDPHHPENLTFEDLRFEEKDIYKEKNIYYRYQRDKNSGRFSSSDGKNGK